MTNTTYTFTRIELIKLLTQTISMFVEYRDKHDKSEDIAPYFAIQEMIEGLDAIDEIKSFERKPE